MAKSRVTEFNRTPGNVFVNVPTPQPVQQLHQPERYYQDWTDVAKQIASDTPITPEPLPEPVPVADAKEIRIYAVDCTSGKRQRLFTGKHTDDTSDLCQCYANLADCRVELHDAASAKVYHPETYPIPTLQEWCEVYNSDTGRLLWVGLRESGFDKRCRTYADRSGSGLRVDSAHLNHSQFYTPKNEVLSYAKQNAEHFARKHGLAVGDAVGMITITAVAWAAYIIGGVA